MRLENFRKYKKLIESGEADMSDPTTIKVYEWMTAYDLVPINEGLWGAIWGWLKRNFTPTASKIHKLADEFAQELEEEYRAEFEKQSGSKDLASKLRTSYGGRLSQDIEEKMRLAAGDDSDYQELVRTLVTKKTYEVKSRLLDEYQEKLEPEDYADIKSEIGKASEDVEKEYDDLVSKLSSDQKKDTKKISAELRQIGRAHV